jgi:hypothetical protein
VRKKESRKRSARKMLSATSIVVKVMLTIFEHEAAGAKKSAGRRLIEHPDWMTSLEV